MAERFPNIAPSIHEPCGPTGRSGAV